MTQTLFPETRKYLMNFYWSYIWFLNLPLNHKWEVFFVLQFMKNIFTFCVLADTDFSFCSVPEMQLLKLRKFGKHCNLVSGNIPMEQVCHKNTCSSLFTLPGCCCLKWPCWFIFYSRQEYFSSMVRKTMAHTMQEWEEQLQCCAQPNYDDHFQEKGQWCKLSCIWPKQMCWIL